jgi:hypothetical protein
LRKNIPANVKFRVHRIYLRTTLLSVFYLVSSLLWSAKPLLSVHLACHFDGSYQIPALVFMAQALITISLPPSNNLAHQYPHPNPVVHSHLEKTKPQFHADMWWIWNASFTKRDPVLLSVKVTTKKKLKKQ